MPVPAWKETMKVILQKNVPSLGDAGDIKEVAAGYARNYLIPRKLVIGAKEGSTKALKHQKAVIRRKTEKRKKEMQGVAEELKKLSGLELKVRVGARNRLFGSVTAMQVAAAITEKGITLDKRKIELGDKIRALGNFNIKIRLAESIVVPFTIQVTADENSVIEEEYLELRPMPTEEEAKAIAAAKAAAAAEAENAEAGAETPAAGEAPAEA